jgi:chromosome segregation ATPase
MPGTSAETSRLHETIVELQRALDLARANEKRALDVANASTRSVQQRDEVIHKRQTEYENVSNELRETKTTLESEQKRLEGVLRTKVLTEDRNRKHQADIVDLKGELAALRAANLASEDEKVAEITRLKKENEDLVKSRDAAVRDKETADKMQEYIKDQLRLAQNQAAEWKRKYDAQQEENERLQPLASGEATTLKNIHYGRSLEELKRQNELLKIEKGNQARLLQTKDEEIQRLKNGSRGYGTRQSSVPRSPRVGPGSRTGSPAPRDRLSNLRNG